MLGEDGGVVDDGAVFGGVYHIHRDELSTEGHHVEFRLHTLVLLEDL